MDYRPKPLSEDTILALQKKLQETAKKESEVQALAGLKNELEAAIYGSRDKLDKEEIIKVSTEEQREEITKLCAEFEEAMYEPGASKSDYEAKLEKLQDLLGPIQERALEYEARQDLPDFVKEELASVKQMQAHVEKNMSWVGSNKTEAAVAKVAEFAEWWSKKLKQQRGLPLHDAPAFTKLDVVEKLSKLKKEWEKLKKMKKPKETKPKSKASANATKADDTKKTEEALPATVDAAEKELSELREKKISAVENEDFDAAHVLKQREQALVKQLAKLKEQGDATDEGVKSGKSEL